MSRLACATAWLSLLLSIAWINAAEQDRSTRAGIVRLAGNRLQIGLDAATGSLRELIDQPGGFNQLGDHPAPLGLWQIAVQEGTASYSLAAERAGEPTIDRCDGQQPGWRLAWNKVPAGPRATVRVEVQVRLNEQDSALSRWELSIAKPKGVQVRQIRFPRVPSLRQRPEEVLAVPRQLGVLTRDPRRLTQGRDHKGHRLCWHYPFGTELSLQCLAFYQQDGPGLYAACDDAQGCRKDFAMWGDEKAQLHLEIVHEPEPQAAGLDEFRLPYAVVLGAFRGDWTAAAEIYRRSPAAQAIAARGRLSRGLTPGWVPQTGLWLWNRGRSPQVLDPAVALRKHVQAPVSILWHWWHHCPYDAGFPEFLPPREGAEPFQAALAAAQRQDVHAILYMNQRLWGMRTESWAREGAEAYAVKAGDGRIRAEVYNTFLKAPCAAMCIGTHFWREKYAGLAREVLGELKADGIYMDQAGVWAECFDPRHGHPVGPGRYWNDGLATLTAEIRARTATRGPVALGCEYCGEPWIGDLDVTLALSVAHDRIGGEPGWEPIPFYPAVYHRNAVVFGNLAGLTHPPYDEKWPPEQAPANRLTLLERRFARQFYLEQARTFVWGMQPMLANFFPSQVQDRAEEIDFVARLVGIRQKALKYLLYGTWLRPPALDVPKQEIDIAHLGVYTPLRSSRRVYPVALAGAWRADDGDVAIALASIHDQRLPLRVPVDAQAYGLPASCIVWRIDASGRHRVGAWQAGQRGLPIELPPRGLCVLEFCGDKTRGKEGL